MKVALLNPNTSAAVTEGMAAAARAVLPAEVTVAALTAPRGPDAIEGHEEQAIAAAVVVEMMRAHAGYDAYLIGCFGDPGLYAARELSRAPVVGVGEAALMAACQLGRRFAILTTLARGISALEDRLYAHGLRDRCAGVRATGIPVLGHGGARGDGLDSLRREARLAVADGADVIVLACGSMAGEAAAVSAAAGVPVVDGVPIGALFAFSLAQAGLWTSKSGAFAPPEPATYVNMPPAW